MMTGRWQWLYFIWSRGENNFRYGSNFQRLYILNFLSILNLSELAASGASVIFKDIIEFSMAILNSRIFNYAFLLVPFFQVQHHVRYLLN